MSPQGPGSLYSGRVELWVSRVAATQQVQVDQHGNIGHTKVGVGSPRCQEVTLVLPVCHRAGEGEEDTFTVEVALRWPPCTYHPAGRTRPLLWGTR